MMNSSSMLEDFCEDCGSGDDDLTASSSSSSSASNWTVDVNVTTNATVAVTNTTPVVDTIKVLNVTNRLLIRYALPMYGYVMPFLFVITIVANTLIVVVLSKRHMRTPTNLVLMAMALSDMFTLLFPAPWFFYMYTLGNHYKPLFPVAACYGYQFMQEVLPNLCHTASIWLTLALAIQRYVYVCLPPMARTCCTVPLVKRGILWIYVLASLHQSSRFVDTVYKGSEIEWNGRPTPVCAWEFAVWVKNVLTENVYFNIYFWFRIVFVHVVPCTLLVVLNVLLFGAMRRAQMKRRRLLKDNRKSSECNKLRDSNCTTLMLIVVVTVFLAVEIPLAVISVLHTVQSTFNHELLDYDVANALILFTNFIIMLSYPINFAIYCGMSRQFRETFKELFISGGTTNAAAVGGAVSTIGGGGTRRDGSSRYSMVNGPRTCSNETVL